MKAQGRVAHVAWGVRDSFPEEWMSRPISEEYGGLGQVERETGVLSNYRAARVKGEHGGKGLGERFEGQRRKNGLHHGKLPMACHGLDAVYKILPDLVPPLICFPSLLFLFISRMLYKWNHRVYNVLRFFHSA